MNWLIYLLQVNIYLLAFYAFYRLVLANETFFNMNRLFLVGSAVISFLIPILQSDWVNSLLITQQARQVAASISITDYYAIQVVADDRNPLTLSDVLAWVYISGLALFSIRLLYKFYILKKLIGAREKAGRAFSFFGYISVDRSHEKSDTIHKHEQVHARQLHSADVLFFELLMAVNWFNPVVYLYRKAIRNIHEYIADHNAAANEDDKSAYALLLVSQTFGIEANQLTNNFFNSSLLKQRISMLHKSRSKKIALLKYGLSAPLFIGLLILSSAFVSDKSEQTVNAIAPATIVHYDWDKHALSATLPTPTVTLVRFPPPVVQADTIIAKNAQHRVNGIMLNAGNQDAQWKASGQILGTLPGVAVQAADPVSAGNLMIRLTANQDEKGAPLYVVDGVPKPDASLSGLSIDPHDIESINVLKKADASSHYGPRGDNGVILITTKDEKETAARAGLEAVTVRGYATTKTANDIKSFASVEIIPSFPGGMKNFYEYVARNYNYPSAALAQNITGRVTLSFVVEKDGSLSDIKILRDLGFGTGEEAVRLLQNSPKWQPGIQNGNPVRVAYTLPITLNAGNK